MPTLKNFLAENPAAQVEYNQALEEKYKAGVEAGKQEIKGDVKKISPFLTSETYDSAIKQTAVKVLTGEIGIDAFLAVVSIEDARKEKEKSSDAKKETKKIGNTPGQQQQTGGNETGDIKTEADFQAEITKIKAQEGGK